MKRNERDEWMELAFGEVAADEAVALESRAQIDPQASKALRECRALREGLESLRTVPEDQLSVERLRAAVLDRGLKPDAGRSWTWVPAAAAILAISIVGTRFLSKPQAQTVINAPGLLNSAHNLALNVGNQLNNALANSEPSVDRVPIKVDRGQAPDTASATRSSHRHTDAASTLSTSSMLASMSQKDHPFGENAVSSLPPSETTTGLAARPDQGGASAESIVLLHSGSNAKTAGDSVNNATEVANGTDLIIGG